MSTDPVERIRVKAKRYLRSEVYREDIPRGFSREGEHLFYRMSMPFAKTLDIYDSLSTKLEASPYKKDLVIRNLSHPDDTHEFHFMYNAIFLAAPDPTRPLTIEEAAGFPDHRTFIATLWHSFAGFIYLVVEEEKSGTGERVGAIAGIGVLPKYRKKKIGLSLLKMAIDFFQDKDIDHLVCEVYHQNIASLKMFQGLGMEVIGHMILEESQP